MKLSRPWRLAGRALYWGAVGVLAFLFLRQVFPSVSLEEIAEPAPPLEGVTLDGGPFHLDELRGQVVVLNFWATWCLPCRAEMPGFVTLSDEVRGDGVVFVGYAVDREGAAVVRPFVEHLGVTYPIVLGPSRAQVPFGGSGALPTTLLIDRQGRIRYRHEGFLVASSLRPALRALARERATP